MSTTSQRIAEADLPSKDFTTLDVVYGAYFGSRPDPQSGDYIPRDSKTYYDHWLDSCAALDLDVVVLHDSALSPDFIRTERARYAEQTGRDALTFTACTPGPFSLNDERFLALRELLLARPCRWGVMTDISDVWFGRNPHAAMRAHPEGQVFTGIEHGTIGDNRWMVKTFKRAYGSLPEALASRPVFNCGVLGGRQEHLLGVLDEMHAEYQSLTPHKKLFDMAIHNTVLHRRPRKTIIAGGDFTSPWKLFCTSGPYAVFHK